MLQSAVSSVIPATAVSSVVVSGALVVEVVKNLAAFDALQIEWGQLVREADTTVFQTFEWLRTWWRHYEEGQASAKLHIVVIRSPEKLVAIAPFFIDVTRIGGIVELRKLAFIGTDSTDYLDVIVEKGAEKQCIPLIARHLAKQSSRFDVLHLVDIPDRSPTHTLLFRELIRCGFSGDHFVNEYCPRVTLRSSWEDTLTSLPSSKRSSLKRVHKKVTADFDVGLEMALSSDRLQDDLSEFVQLHQNRWNGSGHLGVFADPRAEAFHREFASLAFQRKWLFLAFLQLNGKRVAANYAFNYNGVLYYYLSGIDLCDSLAKYSLGRVLHMRSISKAITQGCRVYDFMRGTERYKYDFNGVDATNWTMLLYSPASELVETRFKMLLLFESLQRRVARERLLWKLASAGEGASVLALVKHLASRLQTNFRDGVQKLHSPEKSLTIKT